MISKKEIGHIILAIMVLTFVTSLYTVIKTGNYSFILQSALFLFIILLVNIFTKKSAAEYYESTLETKIWHMQRYGFKREDYFKFPLPTGIILPFLASILSSGKVFWFAVMESDIQGTSARASKKHGIYRFTEMTEFHISLIIASGVVANLILAVISYLINVPLLGKLSIYYAAFSLIPFGNLDGMKILMGNKVLWFTLSIITLIFLAYALFLP